MKYLYAFSNQSVGAGEIKLGIHSMARPQYGPPAHEPRVRVRCMLLPKHVLVPACFCK